MSHILQTFGMLFEFLRRMDARVAKMSFVLPKWLQIKEDLGPLQGFLRRVVVYLLIVAVIALILWVVYWYVLHVGPKGSLTDPALQQSVPTAAPTPTARTITDPWAGHTWLSQTDARALREKPNVVNFALLSDGGARYSATSSISFAAETPWQKFRPIGVTGLSVTGTGVTFTADAEEYTLNVLEPFAFGKDPTAIYVVDVQGQVWRASLKDVVLRPIDEVVATLPIGIVPNPNLSFTTGRQPCSGHMS